ncbi:spore protease YyaC [Sulfoacidibacillus thermotolerans]|uniref:Spore protease YyaC n=1 Tax=Sulfoacidibacillus thermotolerans TaxID=1765684 RepID=A0A2U3D6B8_SULT2|nr:spore protease YyaC [Sulfoacidibacillus thermotolerans]
MLNLHKDKEPVRISYNHPSAASELGSSIAELLSERPAGSNIVVMCIGTDRSTGDALGPLVGSELTERTHDFVLYGTLDLPVHAVNLEQTIARVQRSIEQPYIIAIDACLGQVANIGQISVARGALQPGAGVHKQLPSVGDIHITGIVNVGGFMEYFVLQNTRLSIVFRMANVIADALSYASELHNLHLSHNANITSRSTIPRFSSLFKSK